MQKNGKEQGAGRPYKMENWVNELEEVLESENIFFLAKKDLVFLTNDRLPKDDRISVRTLEKWNAGQNRPEDEELVERFEYLIEKSLIRQKMNLEKKMMESNDKNWTRIAWIMERKFSEWNLKKITENVNRNEQSTVIQITAGNEKQKELIQSIIDIDFEVIKPIEIPAKTNNEKTEEYDF